MCHLLTGACGNLPMVAAIWVDSLVGGNGLHYQCQPRSLAHEGLLGRDDMLRNYVRLCFDIVILKGFSPRYVLAGIFFMGKSLEVSHFFIYFAVERVPCVLLCGTLYRALLDK